MGLALRAMDLDYRASDEAMERISSAKLGDVAFLVRSIVGKAMPPDDVSSLARAIYAIDQGRGTLTKAGLIARLMDDGRSRDKAEQLTRSVLR